jgi:SAM-dependent methyltransferase
MTASGFKDLFSAQSMDYARYRPRYPEALFDALAGRAPGRELAWDCGTGSGQAAVSLARRFGRVIATDPSRKQLESAEGAPGLAYAVAGASRSPLADRSCDLVTAAQAFHWFDQPAFYRECERVLKPGGVVAFWCYGLCEVSPEVDALVLSLYDGMLGQYWDPERTQVEEGYARAELPFEEIAMPAFEMSERWGVERMIGYLGTWSALRKCVKETGGNPLRDLVPRLEAAWGDGERRVRWRLGLRAGRVG